MAISGYILKRQKIKNKSYMLPFRKVDKEQVKSKVSKKKKKCVKLDQKPKKSIHPKYGPLQTSVGLCLARQEKEKT